TNNNDPVIPTVDVFFNNKVLITELTVCELIKRLVELLLVTDSSNSADPTDPHRRLDDNGIADQFGELSCRFEVAIPEGASARYRNSLAGEPETSCFLVGTDCKRRRARKR